MDVKVFLSSHFKESCSAEQADLLVSRFKEYKQTGVPHSTFGQDTTYDFPFQVKQSGMYHIHIKDAKSRNWHLKKVAFDKKSDTALIYCEGFNYKNHYLLLGFLENAHETCRTKPLYLLGLSDIADRFRDKF
jgi:mRNA interferase YafO